MVVSGTRHEAHYNEKVDGNVRCRRFLLFWRERDWTCDLVVVVVVVAVPVWSFGMLLFELMCLELPYRCRCVLHELWLDCSFITQLLLFIIIYFHFSIRTPFYASGLKQFEIPDLVARGVRPIFPRSMPARAVLERSEVFQVNHRSIFFVVANLKFPFDKILKATSIRCWICCCCCCFFFILFSLKQVFMGCTEFDPVRRLTATRIVKTLTRLRGTLWPPPRQPCVNFFSVCEIVANPCVKLWQIFQCCALNRRTFLASIKLKFLCVIF